MKVLVTGGAGFIGSHIAEELVKQDNEVIILDNLVKGKMDNIKHFFDNVQFVEGDIRDIELLKKVTKGVDFISHQAALRSVPASVDSPEEYNDVNINGHFNVLEAARLNGVKTVVFASSSSVYGNAEEFPSKETFRPDPISPYAITKLTGEAYCKYFYEQYGLNAISLRYFNVYGPRQDPFAQYAAVVAILIRKILNGEKPEIHWDGEQSRDFTYVKDVAAANINAFSAKNCAGDIFNICDGKVVSVNKILQLVNRILGKNVEGIHTEKRQGDVRKTMGDPTKAKEMLGFTCNWSFEDGLKKTVEWFAQNK